ncbi:PmoA family protein [Glycomyces halotolerans]
MTLQLEQIEDKALSITSGDLELLHYVYRPDNAQFESPRPYFEPLRDLAGHQVSLYRPHDHVWHKGIALSLPNCGPENFWGGATFRRGKGYVDEQNDGSMLHKEFSTLETDGETVRAAEDLDWVTQDGRHFFSEKRAFAVTVPAEDTWVLSFSTAFTNDTDQVVVMGSPTTEGRENAGYGGFFWRGPRSFTGGEVYAPDAVGGDDLMGKRGDWLAFHGKHDSIDAESTLVFTDHPDNPGAPVKWFVRTTPFAAVCPAPFFDTELPMEPGQTVTLRHAVAVRTGDTGPDGAAKVAEIAAAELARLG